jgi:hypothetical protein
MIRPPAPPMLSRSAHSKRPSPTGVWTQFPAGLSQAQVRPIGPCAAAWIVSRKTDDCRGHPRSAATLVAADALGRGRGCLRGRHGYGRRTMSFETGPRDVSERDPPDDGRSAVALLGVPADATAATRAADPQVDVFLLSTVVAPAVLDSLCRCDSVGLKGSSARHIACRITASLRATGRPWRA